MKKVWILVLALVAAAALAGCSNAPNPSAAQKDEDVSERILRNYQKSQPVEEYSWSQLRENLRQIQAAQVNTTATTSFFFNQGVEDPIMTCPSVGFPIATTAQLTSPEQVVGNREGGYATTPQLEATGIYTGDSTGTYVMCVDPQGAVYGSYWEGYVQTVSGPAEWDAEANSVVLTGDPTGEFTKGK